MLRNPFRTPRILGSARDKFTLALLPRFALLAYHADRKHQIPGQDAPHWPCEGCRQRAMCGLRPTNSAEQPSTKDTCRKVQAYTGDSQHVD
jgi:hypothetical protein